MCQTMFCLVNLIFLDWKYISQYTKYTAENVVTVFLLNVSVYKRGLVAEEVFKLTTPCVAKMKI